MVDAVLAFIINNVSFIHFTILLYLEHLGILWGRKPCLTVNSRKVQYYYFNINFYLGKVIKFFS